MAKSTFTCIECGDTVTVVGNNRADADRRCRRESSNPCWDCRKAAASKSAAEAAVASGLSALTGVSEKQVAYGESKRAEVIRSQAYIRETTGIDRTFRRLSDVARAEFEDAWALVWGEMLAKTEAKFWIEEAYGFARKQLEKRGPDLMSTAAAEAEERAAQRDAATQVA